MTRPAVPSLTLPATARVAGGATQTARKSGAPGRPLPRRPANVRWCEGPVPRPPPPPGQSNLGPRARGRTIGHQHLRICVGRGRGLPGQTGPVPKASPPAGHRYGTRPAAPLPGAVRRLGSARPPAGRPAPPSPPLPPVGPVRLLCGTPAECLQDRDPERTDARSRFLGTPGGRSE